MAINPSDRANPPRGASVTRTLAFLKALGASLRTAWLILGISLALLLVMELLYRGQGALRRTIARATTARVPNPHEQLPWWGEFAREDDISTALRWKPYVYFRRRTFAGNFINVDSSGIRRTVQPEPETEHVVDTVLMFGGSTMWGAMQRDQGTIPSVLAARLAEHDTRHTRIVNLGEMGYVFTQEVLELLLQLQDGARPRAVVFYNGLNDVAATVQSGLAGVPQNEDNRARDFRVGTTMFSWKSDLGAEFRALGSIGGALGSRSQLVQRLVTAVRPVAWQPRPPEELAADILRMYVNNVRMVEALADDFGFEVIYLWQPSLHTTKKRLTPFERQLMGTWDSDPFHSTSKTVHQILAHDIDSAVGGLARGRFFNLSDLFATDTTEVYVDEIGHTTERANTDVVEAFLPILLPILSDSSS